MLFAFTSFICRLQTAGGEVLVAGEVDRGDLGLDAFVDVEDDLLLAGSVMSSIVVSTVTPSKPPSVYAFLIDSAARRTSVCSIVLPT